MKKFIFLLIILSSTLFSQNMDKILVWSEEFDYNGLPDKTKWNFETEGNAWGWGNGEDQFYTDSRLENAIVTNGILKIIALEESMGGKKYTSARINTKGKAEWRYGRFEAKIKLPSGRGIWPAFWMMPAESYYGGWPASGEIDIMEMFGWHNPDTAYFTIHTEAYNHRMNTHKQGYYKDSTIHDKFHVYAVEWFSDRLDFYFDDKKVFTYTKENDSYSVWPFDKPFYIILNNAVGGDWCRQNGGIGNTKFPQILEVDYVRVYKFKTNKKLKLDIEETVGGKILIKNKEFNAGEKVKLTPISDNGYKFAIWNGDIVSKKGELEFNIFEDIKLKPKFVLTNEILVNGDFASGFVDWNFWVDSAFAKASFRVIDEKMNVNIEKIGNYDWQVQLSTPVQLKKGSKYVLKFKARANSTKFPLRAGFNQNHEPWKSYYSKTIELDREFKEYNIDFIMNENNDPNSRVEFDFGKKTGGVIIDDVSLVEE
ncbi:MAG: family 16 glycosylhydrolase [Brevinematales bacterium]|nr:family 16 glycosylhydrolase [Brevinematales bacterium]